MKPVFDDKSGSSEDVTDYSDYIVPRFLAPTFCCLQGSAKLVPRRLGRGRWMREWGMSEPNKWITGHGGETSERGIGKELGMARNTESWTSPETFLTARNFLLIQKYSKAGSFQTVLKNLCRRRSETNETPEVDGSNIWRKALAGDRS